MVRARATAGVLCVVISPRHPQESTVRRTNMISMAAKARSTPAATTNSGLPGARISENPRRDSARPTQTATRPCHRSEIRRVARAADIAPGDSNFAPPASRRNTPIVAAATSTEFRVENGQYFHGLADSSIPRERDCDEGDVVSAVSCRLATPPSSAGSRSILGQVRAAERRATPPRPARPRAPAASGPCPGRRSGTRADRRPGSPSRPCGRPCGGRRGR